MSLDVLMVTHNRPAYTTVSLGHLLDSCDDSMRVWVRHNGLEDAAEVGVAACWHFQPEDFDPRLAGRKIRTLPGGHRLMVNPWVQGSGVMMKRACVEQVGLLGAGDTFTQWCIRAAANGWINGWHVPLVPIDHMDDPRSPRTALRTDADMAARTPLSAQHRNTGTVDEWIEHLRMSARAIQEAPADPRLYVGVRKKIRRTWARLRRREVLS